MELIKQTFQKARKDYPCMAYEWISNVCDDLQCMTFAERKQILIAKRNNGMIKAGQRYMYQFLVSGGDKYNFKVIPELHNICLKYDIYPND